MATTTTNLGLILPAVSDAADIGVLNANFEKIDALGGYGLGGTYAKMVSDCNDATANGFYSLAGSGTANAPGWNLNYGTMLVTNRSNGSQITQIVTYANVSAVRSYVNGAWTEWEYENPPMQLGVEYRTTERWDGAPVYMKMVDCGELPNAGQKVVEFATETTAAAINLYGRAVKNGELITIPYAGNGIIVSGYKNRVVIGTTADYSGWYGYVVVKYTK